MPEFIAQHVPPVLDDFTRGYIECAEWLLPEHEEEPKREDATGWALSAVAAMIADCEEFQTSYPDKLERYEEVTGCDMASAGRDFFLTRNRHGAGFWDRGDDPVLEELTDAAQARGECDTYVGDDLLIYIYGRE